MTSSFPSERAARAPGPHPGTRIGRYVVTERIGHGGIGAVFLAFDPQLARRVAIKVIRAELASEHARARMIREARAMAQLSHPNVVAIFDVGMHENSVYIAMEYVDGETLETWIGKPRTRREVLSVMEQAGRGLAAAHAAGIVHRDFKPANVVIAKDARVRVLDFGIAFGEPLREAREPRETLLTHATNVRGLDGLGDRLTEEGAVVGTVGYFAPEAIFDQPVDARADIFGFCVTLFRALTGRLPFPESSMTAYLDAIFEEPRERLRDPALPDWLATVIDRGLRTSPSDRYATIDELLAALDETEAWKAPLAIGIFALAIAVTAGVTLNKARQDAEVGRMCRAEADAIATSWSPAARDAVEHAMRADLSSAAITDRVLAQLDAYALAWRSEQSASCEATLITKTQAEPIHEKRSQCLVEGRMQLAMVAEALARPDARWHAHAVREASILPPPRACTALASGETMRAMRDDALRDPSTEALHDLLYARVLLAGDAFEDAQRAAEHAMSLAHRAEDRSFEARAENLLAASLAARSAEGEALAHVRHAAATAEGAGADHVTGMSAAAAASLLAKRDREDALAWQGLARGKLARLGSDPLLALAILRNDVALEIEPARAEAARIRMLDDLHALYGEDTDLE